MNRFRHRDALLGHPALGVLPVKGSASGGGIDTHQWIDRRDGPVRAEGQHRTLVQQRPPGITPLDALGPQSSLGPTTVIDCMIGLHRGNNAKRRETCRVLGPQMLDVLDTKTMIAGPVLPFRPLEQIKHGMNRAIADRMHRNLRSEEHTSELQSQSNLVCRLLLEKKKKTKY